MANSFLTNETTTKEKLWKYGDIALRLTEEDGIITKLNITYSPGRYRENNINTNLEIYGTETIENFLYLVHHIKLYTEQKNK